MNGIRLLLLLLCAFVGAPLRAQEATLWVALRTDGLDGTGTREDPRDGSSAEKFDALFATLPPGATVRLGLGTFETRGVARDAKGDPLPGGIQLPSGASLRGEGRERTTIRLAAGAMPAGPYTKEEPMRRDLIVSRMEAAGNHVSDLTVDGHRDAQEAFTNGSAYSYQYAVNLAGLECSIRHVTVRNLWQSGEAFETFPVTIASKHGTWLRPARGTIEGCIFESAPGYRTAINLLAPGLPVHPGATCTASAETDRITTYDDSVWADGATVYFHGLAGGAGLSERQRYFVRDALGASFKVALTDGGAAVDLTSDVTAGGVIQQTWITGAIRNCVVHGRTSGAFSGTQGFGCAGWKDVVVEDCQTVGTSAGVFLDTHHASGITIRRNTFDIRADPEGNAGFAIFLGGGFLWDDLRVQENVCMLSNNAAAVRLNGGTRDVLIEGNTIRWAPGLPSVFPPSFVQINETYGANQHVRLLRNRIAPGIDVTAHRAAPVWSADNRALDGTPMPGLPDSVGGGR